MMIFCRDAWFVLSARNKFAFYVMKKGSAEKNDIHNTLNGKRGKQKREKNTSKSEKKIQAKTNFDSATKNVTQFRS